MTLSKRLFDLCVAVILCVVLGPVILVLSLWVMIKQGRPIFYASERMKTDTQGFQLIKFRTMTVVDHDHGVSGADKAARITPLGGMMRKYRLDELPQLWNVLRGDISFVGPRPPLRQYVEQFPDIYGQVLKSRPGITGMASVFYHRHEEYLLSTCDTAAQTDAVYVRNCIPRKAHLDLIYQAKRTVCLDMWLMVRTVIRKK